MRYSSVESARTGQTELRCEQQGDGHPGAVGTRVRTGGLWGALLTCCFSIWVPGQCAARVWGRTAPLELTHILHV